jgi:hypothetical protein
MGKVLATGAVGPVERVADVATEGSHPRPAQAVGADSR